MELFQTYSESGELLGLVERSQVHQSGLWHKAAQVFLFNSRRELLVQKRAAQKDLYPDHWDSSVGEHLIPGESYIEGARRGLREELGVTLKHLTPLGSEQRMILEGEGFRDCEFQLAFQGLFDGLIIPDEQEVEDVKWVNSAQLAAMFASPDVKIAPWFRHHYSTYDFRNSFS